MSIILFWVFVSIFLYTWIGYPLLLFIYNLITRKRQSLQEFDTQFFPLVSIIVPVFNGESSISRKIENLLSLEYPTTKIEILIGSDGSTDKTGEIVNQYKSQGIILFEFQRIGKTRVQNELVSKATGEIIVFTDVDSVFNKDTLGYLVLPFQNDNVGCVAGHVEWSNLDENAITEGGGVYWNFEKMLWTLESELGMLAWGSGTCLAVKKSIFHPMPFHLGEDCIVPLDIVDQGYLVKYAPEALVYDLWATTPKEEFNARVRMTLRSFTGTISKKSLLSFIRFPKLSWAIWSHKLFRWLTPFFLMLIFITNFIAIRSSQIYLVFFIIQSLTVTLGIIGLYLYLRGYEFIGLSHLGSFILVIIGFALADLKVLTGKKITEYQSIEARV